MHWNRDILKGRTRFCSQVFSSPFDALVNIGLRLGMRKAFRKKSESKMRDFTRKLSKNDKW